MPPRPAANPSPARNPGLFGLLKGYRPLLAGLMVLALGANALSLSIPRLIARGIDAFQAGRFQFFAFAWPFVLVAAGIFLLVYGQNVLQTVIAERVARDLRERLADRISRQGYLYVQTVTPAKLLTHFTSDIDAVKLFVSQAIVSIVSSLFLIIGVSTLLLLTHVRLALATLLVLPLIGGAFFLVFSKVGPLFRQTQQIIDALNKTINESILGAALIRVLNAQQPVYERFLEVNARARALGLDILRLFASVIPVISFATGLATLAVLVLGGRFVMDGSMTLGQLTAFNGYLALLIFPILIIGFMSNAIGRAAASYGRLAEVLEAPLPSAGGALAVPVHGDLEVRGISLAFGEKQVLKDVSFTVKAGTKTAILGPTAAGKTQLLSVLVGLVPPTAGNVRYDGRLLAEYDQEALYRQIGFVFQDSLVFNATLRENIAFNSEVSEEALQKALAAAELAGFVAGLPDGLETVVSERGTSLSGGQKQRLMLARALALAPKILLLDDFTSRVDIQTERRILEHIRRDYPGLTVVSVTQKVAAVEAFDQIIVLMEGEVLARGTHDELMDRSPEYLQILRSQRSTDV